jgi:hypothetical protein
MDRRIINNILSSFEKKLMKRSEIVDRFKEILQNECNKNIIRNLRHSNDIIYVLYDYYYIVSPLEKSGHYLEYSTNEMVYAVLNKLNIRWYHGLDSALEYNQLIWQGIVNPVIINNHFSGKRVVHGITYHFHKIKDDLFGFGTIKKKTNNNIVFFYSDIEKTYLDFFYLKRRAPQELKKRIDWKRAKQYMNKYPRSIKRKVYYQ